MLGKENVEEFKSPEQKRAELEDSFGLTNEAAAQINNSIGGVRGMLELIKEFNPQVDIIGLFEKIDEAKDINEKLLKGKQSNLIEDIKMIYEITIAVYEKLSDFQSLYEFDEDSKQDYNIAKKETLKLMAYLENLLVNPDLLIESYSRTINGIIDKTVK